MQSEYIERAKKLIENNDGFARTGCTLLDCVVGGGVGLGFPFGWMVNIVGDKSSGKTFLAWELIAKNFYDYKKRLKWNYDASESGNTFATEVLFGEDLINHEQHFDRTSNLVEEMDGNVSLFLKTLNSDKQRGIYVVDSLDGLSDEDKEKQEKEFEKLADTGKKKDGGSYNTGTASHLSKQFFRTKAGKLMEKHALLMIISQVREKLNAGMFEKKTYRAGGKAMDFYAHTCLWLYNRTKIKKNDKVVGLVVKAKSEKSKTPRPYRECTFTLYFDYGIDDIGSNLDYLYDLRGEDGKLTKKANEIGGIDRSLKNYKLWLEENNLYELAQTEKKEETNKKNLSVDWLDGYTDDEGLEVTGWVYKDKARAKLADEYFGECKTRDELIERAESDPEYRKELEILTIAKWEEEEDKIKTNRKGKYES